MGPTDLSPWAVAPFVTLLLCIAVLPLLAPHAWERNRNKALVSGGLALGFAAYLMATTGHAGRLELHHALLDYGSFMALLGALFVVSSGIFVRGSLSGSPIGNTLLLAIGAVLANLVGTTGASMVLIRPFLRANRTRQHRTHQVVFFIFIVSNCGGLLTPLGDPPLFLGFLKGVPFEWTLRLWPQWLFVNGALLIVFNFLDQVRLSREEKARPGSQLEDALAHEPLGLDGARNIGFLLLIVASVVAKGEGLFNAGAPWPFGVHESLLLIIGVLSLKTTPPKVYAENRFSFGPIIEVAVLFIGIFVTMVAPLKILNAHGVALGVTTPAHYYWATGVLSSFLDNAPTYLAFAAAAAGQYGVSADGGPYLAQLLDHGPVAASVLAAIACGSVMMGANTYIGNGPNFMVKAIAEENGVSMPSFVGYMAWSVSVLVPLFVLVTLLFF